MGNDISSENGVYLWLQDNNLSTEEILPALQAENVVDLDDLLNASSSRVQNICQHISNPDSKISFQDVLLKAKEKRNIEGTICTASTKNVETAPSLSSRTMSRLVGELVVEEDEDADGVIEATAVIEINHNKSSISSNAGVQSKPPLKGVLITPLEEMSEHDDNDDFAHSPVHSTVHDSTTARSDAATINTNRSKL